MKHLLPVISLLTLAACGERQVQVVPPATPASAPPLVTHSSAPSQNPASVLDAKALMKCSAETNTVQRLACFDDFAKINNLAPKTIDTTPNTPSKWITSSDKDPLTDKAVHLALLEADEGMGRYGGKVVLAVRCKSGKTSAYINWNTFLGSEGLNVTSRIDKASATTSYWNISTDHTASFMPQPLAALQKFEGASSYVVNLTPYSESPITAIFDIRGADVAFADIKRDCNWEKLEEEKRQRSDAERKKKEVEEKARRQAAAEEMKSYEARDCDELKSTANKYPNSIYANNINTYLKSTPRCASNK